MTAQAATVNAESPRTRKIIDKIDASFGLLIDHRLGDPRGQAVSVRYFG